jgi:hypothetical protein
VRRSTWEIPGLQAAVEEPCGGRLVPHPDELTPPVIGGVGEKRGNAMRTKTIAALALSTLLLGPAAFAQNSGAGKPGLPGSKSGPTQTQSGTTSPGPSATPQDTSGIQGKPGNKSGPAVQPPKSGATK